MKKGDTTNDHQFISKYLLGSNLDGLFNQCVSCWTILAVAVVDLRNLALNTHQYHMTKAEFLSQKFF
jgi:hypothetical protein